MTTSHSQPKAEDVDFEVPVHLSFPDEPEADRLSAVVKISGRTLAISVCERWGNWDERRYVPFTGPGLLQRILTPLAALKGMLFSKRDITWIGMDSETASLRITPIVPEEFWLDIHFQCNEDAREVASRIDKFWE